MAKERVRIAFVGVGQIAQSHLRQYRDIPEAQIVAAADINAPHLATVAAEFAIPNTYTDFRKMLERDDIDAVDVCLHNNLHMPVTVAALEAGKDVYCEKPMAGSYVDAATMLTTAKTTGQKLSIQLSTLFAKETQAARLLIDAGRLGHVYHARSTGYRRRGRPFVDGYGSATFVQKEVAAGGALYDMGVYHIAQMLYLLGNPTVSRIVGKTYQETEMDADRRAKSGYNVEELGLGFVHFANGATLDIIESWAVHMNAFESSSIFGSQGGIRLQPFSYCHHLEDVLATTSLDLDEFCYRQLNVKNQGTAYTSPQHHWIAALLGRTDLLPTADIALNTMLISEGIFMSEQSGQEVTAAAVAEASISTALNL